MGQKDRRSDQGDDPGCDEAQPDKQTISPAQLVQQENAGPGEDAADGDEGMHHRAQNHENQRDEVAAAQQEIEAPQHQADCQQTRRQKRLVDLQAVEPAEIERRHDQV